MIYICTEDIENLAAQGKKELIVDENTVLMELARDTARQLGIAILDGSHPAPAKASSQAVPPSPEKDGAPSAAQPPAKTPSQPAPAASSNGAALQLGAKPKGCQHGPLAFIPRQAPVKNHQSSDGVVDQLVELVRLSVGKPNENQGQK
ncbi:MAG TPA: hypothetical protein VGJ97_10485 [Anaerolineaceae bacterium]